MMIKTVLFGNLKQCIHGFYQKGILKPNSKQSLDTSIFFYTSHFNNIYCEDIFRLDRKRNGSQWPSSTDVRGRRNFEMASVNCNDCFVLRYSTYVFSCKRSTQPTRNMQIIRSGSKMVKNQINARSHSRLKTKKD